MTTGDRAVRRSTCAEKVRFWLVVLMVGQIATGISLVTTAFFVRAFANEQSATVKLAILTGGTVVGASALGLIAADLLLRRREAA